VLDAPSAGGGHTILGLKRNECLSDVLGYTTQIRPAEFPLSRQRGTGDPIAAVTAAGANRDPSVA
jgi:hypothetical protein